MVPQWGNVNRGYLIPENREEKSLKDRSMEDI